MLRTIRAKFKDGVLVPLEPLDLAKDAVVLITLDTNEKFEDWKEPGWMPTTPAEVQEAEAAAEEMIRFIYTTRHRGIDCDCLYCAPAKKPDE